MLVQGWSEANWVQPRNQPVRPLRVTITPARHDPQAGGLASHEGLVQRDERPEMTSEAPPAASDSAARDSGRRESSGSSCAAPYSTRRGSRCGSAGKWACGPA